MKKVLIVSHGNLPIPDVKGGAVEKLVQYIIDYNEQGKDFDLTILSCFDKDAEIVSKKYNNVKFVYLHTVFSKWRLYVNKVFYKLLKFSVLKSDYVGKIQKYLRNNKNLYDVVIFENNPQFILYRMPWIRAKKVFHIHNDWFSEVQMENKLYRSRMTKGATYYDQFFCVSPFIKSNVDRYVSPDKNIVVCNGVDSHLDESKKDEIVTALREKYGIKDSDFIYMYSGRLIREKGVLELLQAFLQTKNENFKLMVVGGVDYSSNAKTEYIRKLEDLASNDKRIVFTGYVDAKLMTYYNIISNVVVIPTYWVEEAAPLTAIEAVHENNVLIVSDSGHLKWWGEQECSMLVKRGKDFVANLAEAMNTIGTDKKFYEEKKQSTEKMSRMHTSKEFYNQFKSFILRLFPAFL